MKVRFTQDHTVKDAEARTYDKGKTYEMNEASALHFTKRGLAVEVPSGTVREAVREAPEAAVRTRGRSPKA